ncbi:hypothetical protein [Nocardioides jejuensis]|uniref:Uncharacterized protein n=1 Tax=Nocardioides jejuensis TaxID=2502782 RepID=A0A4R1BYU9_9ACTN|nr:hypothetical protein [Nocardioides jejuensis]TCJ23211.1 hypothetical protein EPD65_11580 [Nocardioides jejuensis]
MAAQSEVTPALLEELWDLVEEWSSAAIQRARETASEGSSETVDAEIRLTIAHAAELRAVVERHLATDEASTPEAEPAQARTPGTLHEPPQAQVCPECFVMVPIDQLDEHELTCERHHKIERMEQAGLGDVEPLADPTPVVDAEDVDVPEVEQVAPAAEKPPAPTHICNSADFDRPLCEACGGLHWYCSICGAQRDECRAATA